MRAITLLLFLTMLVFACGNQTTEGNDSTDMETDSLAQHTMPSGPVEITPMPETKDFPDAAIRGVTYQNGIFDYSISDGEYKLGMQTPDADRLMCANSTQGQHIHLIIDNEPYIAKYEPNFEQKVEDGEHYILSFLSRSYHESIKHPAAHKVMKVTAKNGAFATNVAVKNPMLFYSRPKGTYTGPNDTKNIMLDFYPVNLTLGADYKVKVEVNGKELMMIDKWQPYYLKNLPMGESTVTLTLIDGTGKTVEAPLNPVSRTITLDAGPTAQ